MNIMSPSTLLLIAVLSTTEVSVPNSTEKEISGEQPHLATIKSETTINALITRVEVQISTSVKTSIDAINIKLQQNISEVSAELNTYLNSFLINK